MAPLLGWACGQWLGGDAGVVAGLFVFAATMWVTEAVHPAVTAWLVVAGAPIVGACTPREAFSALGNPILFLFVGSFMLAEAMKVHGLGERWAAALARRARRRVSALVATSFAAFVLSMWMSNAAATAIVLPVALATGAGDDDDSRRFRAALVLGVAWAASMGGLCTPVGTPPNLMGMRALAGLGHPISFFDWMMVGMPIGVAMWVAMIVVLLVRFRIHPGEPLADRFASERRPYGRGEKAALIIFALAVVLWTVPGVLELMGHPLAGLWRARLSEEVTALLAASLLFFWPIQAPDEPPRRALTWEEAARIDWGTIFLFGGGILLGDLAQKSGLATKMGAALLETSGAATPLAVTALVTLVALLFSELASNTASATLVIPMSLGLADAAHVSPLPAVVGATLGASFGFMMPISTAPNAMAYGTGQVSFAEMVKGGVVFDVIGYVVVVAGVLLLCR